jgi:signal transduction histidine kinase
LLVSADIIEINREPHVIATCIDITQRKLAEAELLRTLARERDLGQLRSNFVSMVSREFRTPLGIIQSSAEILEDYLDQLNPDERKDHLQSIRKPKRYYGLRRAKQIQRLQSFLVIPNRQSKSMSSKSLKNWV